MTLDLAGAQALVGKYGGQLSGSRAFGRPRANSDWDYYMPEAKVKKLAHHLDTMRHPWDSSFLGSLTFKTADGWQVEVSYLYPRTAKEHASHGR